MKRLLWLMVPLMAPLAAAFAAPAANNVYEIEVIVFENRLSDLEGGELWKQEQSTPAAAKKEETTAAGDKNPAESPLAPAKAALEKSGRHRVLAHQRWRQNAEAKSASKPVKVGGDTGEFDGFLRFYLSRLLIVELNLALKDRSTEGGVLAGDSEKGAAMYRLNESRRVRISETHYFDHPKFGALVRVSSIKSAQPPLASSANQP